MNIPRTVNVLWLDDDLRPRSQGVTEERARLQPWLRYFKQPEVKERITVIECEDFRAFRKELIDRQSLPPDSPDYIDVLLIDIFWRSNSRLSMYGFREFDETFAEERIVAGDGGAQTIGLMVNDAWQSRRPDWLQRYIDRPIVVFTSINDNAYTVARWVNPKHVSRMQVLLKDSTAVSGTLVPNDEFIEWANGLRPTAG